jgi:hypothetical protein
MNLAGAQGRPSRVFGSRCFDIDINTTFLFWKREHVPQAFKAILGSPGVAAE